jgi:transposase
MPNQLYLPDWTVAEAVTDRDGAYQIAATYDVAPEACLKCGVVGHFYKHGTKRITYVDAPVHGKQTFINVRRGRYRCRECGGTFMQPLPDMDDERRMTIRCRQYIEAQCLLKPNTHVAEDVGIDEKIVRQIGRAQADRLFEQHEEGIRAPRILGIDELFLGRTMRAIFVDIETSWPIELLPTRWEKPVLNFLMNLPGRDETEIVTMDMWKPYRKAVRYAMPQAVIIVDKWHVQRLANDAMEMARRRLPGRRRHLEGDGRRSRRAGASSSSGPTPCRPSSCWTSMAGSRTRPSSPAPTRSRRPSWRSGRPGPQTRQGQRSTPGARACRRTSSRLFKPVVHRDPQLGAGDHELLPPRRPSHQRATEARNRVIKMTNRLGAGYSFDMIRARALFGKRPGRVKAEKAARGCAPTSDRVLELQGAVPEAGHR